jgi:AcrR family transcriptional regulator
MSKRNRTRQYIIEKTALIFNRKGYYATTLKDCMKATGLSKGGIYSSFSDKDELMIAVFKYNHRILHENFISNQNNEISFREKLLSYPKHYKDNFEKIMLAGGCPIQNTAIQVDQTHSILKNLAHEAIDNWKNKLITLLECGVAAGEFSLKSNDPEQLALTIISSIEGAVMISMLTEKTGEISSVMDWICKQIKELE